MHSYSCGDYTTNAGGGPLKIHASARAKIRSAMSDRAETVDMAAVSRADLDAAYRRCAKIARAHYENFPVVSRFLPRASRRSLAAVYAFARAADDFADEGYGPDGPAAAARLAALDAWERRLRDVCVLGAAGEPERSPSIPMEATEAVLSGSGARSRGYAENNTRGALGLKTHPQGRNGAGLAAFVDRGDAGAVFRALGDTIARHRLDPALFLDLLSAFRQDVTTARYERREDLLDYCRRSASPVGRIVLAVHGARDEERAAMSDAICTGLQLANFWQDVGIDAAKERVYLPREDLARYRVDERDLQAGSASAPLCALVLEETAWARSFFLAGRPLLDEAPARIGFHLRLVWLGGMRILEMIEAAGGDVLGRRPSIGAAGATRLMLRALFDGGTM